MSPHRARALAALIALGVLGCVPVERVRVEAVTAERAPLHLGVLPTDDEATLAKRYAPVTAYLAQKLDRSVELVIASTYDGLGELVDQGKVDLAWFSGVSFLRSRGRHRLVPLARVTRRGKTTYQGAIVVAAASSIQRIEDLKGKRFAYVDRDSGSGFMAPNVMFAHAGIDPLKDLGEVAFSESHAASLRGLDQGRYDAVAVHEAAIEANRSVADPAHFRVLAVSEPLDSDVIAAAEALPAELREAAVKVLLAASSSPDGKAFLAKLAPFDPVDGFVAIPAR